jgi:hypothetical protein
VNKRTKKLVHKYGGQAMPYRELPIPAQLAVAHYMALDGEAWEVPQEVRKWSPSKLKKEFDSLLPYFRKTYGDQRFGYALIPMEALTSAIIQDPFVTEDIGVFDSYEAFDKWSHTQPGINLVRHPTTNRWPVILSSSDDETLQDGWHRFHTYYHQGAEMIPAVYYP